MAALVVTHLTDKDYANQPWKNGKGTTKEIARGAGDPFPWRLSWAGVPESGPFSNFAGYDRSLTLISGGPMSLSHEGKAPRLLAKLQPHLFKGEAATDATVESPAEDFNLFTLRGHAKGAVYPAYFREGEELQFALQRTEHFLFCVEGNFTVLDPNSQKEYSIAPGETLRITRDTEKEFLNLRATPKGAPALGLWVVVALLGEK